MSEQWLANSLMKHPKKAIHKPLRVPRTKSPSANLILGTLSAFRHRGSREGITRIPINNTVFEAKQRYYTFKKPHSHVEEFIEPGVPSVALSHYERYSDIAKQIKTYKGKECYVHVFLEKLKHRSIVVQWTFPKQWEKSYQLITLGNTFDAVWEVLLLYWFMQQRQKALMNLAPDYTIVFTLGALLRILYWEKEIPRVAYHKLKTILRYLRGVQYFEQVQHYVKKGKNKGKPSWTKTDWGSLITRLIEGAEGTKLLYSVTLNEKYCFPLDVFNIGTPQAGKWILLEKKEFREKFPGRWSYDEREDPSKVLTLNRYERQLHNIYHILSPISKPLYWTSIGKFLRERMMMKEGEIKKLVAQRGVKSWLEGLFAGYETKMDIETVLTIPDDNDLPVLERPMRFDFKK